MPELTHPGYPIAGSENKVEGVVKHCLYMIATGKWPEGIRLPSVRAAEQEWALNRLTVQKAYRRLEKMGLVRCKQRSGYYVAEQKMLQRISRHNREIDRLYARFEKQIRSETGLSVLPVFRYLAHIAEIRNREEPECAFVECTTTQARGHAREISSRLSIPVLAFTTDELAGGHLRLPSHVRTVLTSHFHFEELKPVAKSPTTEVFAVPIEVSPDLIEEFSGRDRKAILLETEESMARHIAEDILAMERGIKIKINLVDDAYSALEGLLRSRRIGVSGPPILLSPRLWGKIPARWIKRHNLRQVTFRICDGAWPDIADAIGLPLGGEG